jgi:hypothetical protein
MLAENTLLQSRYLVVRQLGRGGMGAVYEAVDQRLGARVALKETLASGETLRRAFEREARLLSGLRHPALPVVTDYFAEGEGRFLVMQYIPGDDLGALLERAARPFPVETVARWGGQVLDALAFLHAHEPPILHRDVKPQNLKLTPEGSVIVLDFGLAKGASSDTAETTGSVAAYTPNYAPLEQIRGTGTDVRSDLYSLAATLYSLLTARTPADAVTRADAVVNHRPDPLERVDAINPAVPAAMADLIHAALALNRADRPASAAHMRAALAAAAGLPESGAETIVAATVPATKVASAPEPTRPRRARSTAFVAAGVALAVVALLAAVVGAIAVAWYLRRAAEPVGPVNAADASTEKAHPTPLSSTTILGRADEKPYFYVVTAGPGTVDLTLDVVANGATVAVDLFADDKPVRLESGSETVSLGSSGRDERTTARAYLDRKGPVVVRIGCTYPKDLRGFRLRLAGPLDLASRPEKGTDPKVLDAIASLFAVRDAPVPLGARRVVGRGTKQDLSYAFAAGPGDVGFDLSAVAGGATLTVEAFDEQATPLKFEDGGVALQLASNGHDERGGGHLVLDRRRDLVMRIGSVYPDDLKAFRVAIGGPADLPDVSVSAAPGISAGTLSAAFADRDAPAPFPFPEATGRGTPKDVYYAFDAGPGPLDVVLAVTANGSTATVALFDERQAPLAFDGGVGALSVASTGEAVTGTATVTLDRRRRVTLRFSSTYPSDLSAYSISLAGAVAAGAG